MTYGTHLLRHFRRSLGQNIHRLRVKHKMPLRKLAEISGVPELRLDHYELGKNEMPLEHLIRIACALKTGAESLLKQESPSKLSSRIQPLL